MIGVAGALIAAVVLLWLILVWTRSDGTPGELWSDSNEWMAEGGETVEACPPEFVARIFSGDDLAFISRLNSPELERHFRRERDAVALLWVQQTSAAVQRIMRRHVELSRLSEDLEFAVEAKILIQYAQLRMICGVLFLLIGLAGPQRLSGMAVHTDKLTQRIGSVLRELESGTRAGEMNGAGAS